jgi:hypothetical protein
MKWVLSQLAVPAPGSDERVGLLSEQLSITSRVLAESYGLAVHRWDASTRIHAIAEMDARVAKHGYLLERVEYQLVLDSFRVMRRVEEA